MQWGDTKELDFEGLDMQKWSAPADRDQRADKKKGIICLVTVFALGVMAVQMSKKVHFLYFLLMTARNQSQFGLNIQVDLKDLI